MPSVPSRSDNLNRLTSGQAGTLWGNTNQIDAFGNLYQFNSIAGVNPGQSMTLTPTANNQLSGGRVAYDAAGNMSSDTMGIAYYYDAENRIGQTGSTVYSYDGDGNRVMKLGGSANWAYWYGADGEILNEFNTTGGGNYVRNVYLGGALRARRYASTVIDYIAGDQIGSARVVVNSSGTVEDNNDYLPFGGTAPGGTTTSGDIYKFTGKERDTESGLDYFGARYYGSSMGRFSIPDPSGLYFADPSNPQSLNLYSYALNNPLKNTDPTGMYCYYGDTGGGTQEDADLRDDSQFDYHSSQSECETADENGNKGQWINDAGTSQDANGNWVDNADRQPGYMEAATQPSSNQQSSQFDWSKLIPQATFQVGLSLNLGIWGPVTATGFTGFVFDTHGHIGTYRGGGGGASLGAGVSGGVQFGVSNGHSICAVGGPFVNASLTGGAGVAGTVDAFGGKGDGPGGVVVGDGGTIGIGGGAGASVMVTGTTVKPFGNHQCSDGKIQ